MDRTKAVKQGNPLDTDIMIGAQASNDQLEKILSYLDIGKAGRVWTNCYHVYPAHAAFGGYKNSGVGRENHKMMLDHYQQTKNLLVSYSPKALGF